MPEQKWKREISAGGIVYKKENDRFFILLINPRSRNWGPPENYWTFPKGKIEDGEQKEETAVREVREEAGVEAKIIKDLSYIKFFRNYDKTLKFVHYFLMEYISGEPSNHDQEVADAKWVGLEETESFLKWPSDKEIFAKVYDRISN